MSGTGYQMPSNARHDLVVKGEHSDVHITYDNDYELGVLQCVECCSGYPWSQNAEQMYDHLLFHQDRGDKILQSNLSLFEMWSRELRSNKREGK